MNEIYECANCGCTIENEEELYEVEDEIICEDCFNDETFTCSHCGERYFYRNSVSDENTAICQNCYDNYYRRCERCGCIIHDDNVYWDGDYPYCSDCYDEEEQCRHEDRPKEILEKAKKSSKGRYACVNITNISTVEIRLFRGTLKWNTFMASLELVDAICENAIRLNDDELHKQSWADFVMNINNENTELIKYLKEKRLYVNEPVETEEED